MKSFKELVLEAWKDGSWVADVPPQKTKGSRYSGEEYEKEADAEPAKKSDSTEPTEKRGRGRPKGAVSQDTRAKLGMHGNELNKILRGEFEKRTLKGISRKVKGWAQSGSRKDEEDDVKESLDENDVKNFTTHDSYEKWEEDVNKRGHEIKHGTSSSLAFSKKGKFVGQFRNDYEGGPTGSLWENIDESKLLTFKLQHKQHVQSAVAGIGHSSFDDRDGYNIRYDAKDEPKIKQALIKAGMNPFNDTTTSSDKVRTRDYEGVGLGLAAKKKADMEKKNAAKRAKTASKKTNEEVELDEAYEGDIHVVKSTPTEVEDKSKDSISESLMRKVVDKLDIASPGTPYHKIAKDIVKDTFSEPKQTAKDAWDLVKKAASAIHSPIKTADARYESVELDESKKKIGEYSNGSNVAKVYKMTGEHDEGDPYVVHIHKNGKHYEPADYGTNDEADAHGTAKSMVK